MSEELKPCPFCGGKGRIVVDEPNINKNIRIIVRCDRCQFENRQFNISREIMIKLWNTRQPVSEEKIFEAIKHFTTHYAVDDVFLSKVAHTISEGLSDPAICPAKEE